MSAADVATCLARISPCGTEWIRANPHGSVSTLAVPGPTGRVPGGRGYVPGTALPVRGYARGMETAGKLLLAALVDKA